MHTHKRNIKGPKAEYGFTLIELSIVLVIIGLIVGGVLVGQDLIAAATVRAQITQIERYNTTVNTFRGKYDGQLPGDMSSTTASNFGFGARSGAAGQGDGNGMIEGYYSGNICILCPGGETYMFWEDLSTANLLDATFNTATMAATPGVSGSSIALYLPKAKIGRGANVYVYTTGNIGLVDGAEAYGHVITQVNFFGVSTVNSMETAGGTMNSSTAFTVQEAYNIDNKVDDGLPQSGKVQAFYEMGYIVSNVFIWAAGGNTAGETAGAVNASKNSCYDNSGSTSNAMRYSVGTSGGTNINCALSFQFQ